MNQPNVKEVKTIQVVCPKCGETIEVDVEAVATYDDPNVEITISNA